MRHSILTILTGAAIALLVPPLARADTAAEAGGIMIELNKLEPQEGACQAFLVIQNGTPAAFDDLVLDLVMFDTDGVIARRLAVDVAPLRPSRTSVKVFSMQGTACDGIGRMLVNDVLSCSGGEGVPQDCFAALDVVSRAGVELIQ
ncbi:MAG: Tat pathway signal sequence domain protein [Pseudomonadota bacterium]